MNLRIQSRNLNVNDTLRSHIQNKVSRLERHLPAIDNITVDLAEDNARAQDKRFVVQITINVNGTTLRGEERGPNATVALNLVIDVMARRVEKFKGKTYRSKRARKTGTSIRTLDVPEPSAGSAPTNDLIEAAGKVVKVKRFPIKPTTVEEAAFEMEMLGHNFFLFLNSETDQHSVLYRRQDGDYGLIQPEPL